MKGKVPIIAISAIAGCLAIGVVLVLGTAPEQGSGDVDASEAQDDAGEAGDADSPDSGSISFGDGDGGEDGDADSAGSGTIDLGDFGIEVESSEAKGAVPIEVPSDWTLRESYGLSVGDAWVYETDSGVEDCATQVLELLEDSGASLEESGYLGLGDSSWGCVVDMQDGQTAIMVTLIPEEYAISASESSGLIAAVVVFDADEVLQELG